MSKRKNQPDESDSDASLIDVDFEFFDPNPIDYVALKRLITQLFQTDADLLHPHELAELIISQRLVGTSVKTDGLESDPYAYLTVLNLAVHKDNPAVKSLIEYVLTKSQVAPEFQLTIRSLLSSQQVGFIFSERLINMPPQVVPPMYRMLWDEMRWATDDNEPYNFSHFLFISRLYRLSPEETVWDVEMTDDRPSKRPKKQSFKIDRKKDGVYSFHPEDEQIKQYACHTLDYNFSKAEPREKDAFGLDMGGRLMLLAAEHFPAVMKAVSDAYPSSL